MTRAIATPPPDSLDERWTLPAPPVVAPWWVSWLLAAPVSILALLIPRRLGPHLAGSSWWAAYVAHLFGLALLLAWRAPYLPVFRYLWLDPSFSRLDVNELFAIDALLLFNLVRTWERVGLVAAILVAIHALFLIASLALWPLYTVGESRRILAARCAKLILWSTPGLAVLPNLTADAVSWLTWWCFGVGWIGGTWSTLLATLGLVWYLRVLGNLGSRYGGPVRGPRWDPFEPRCERCGYSLTGQTRDGRCPECGRPVEQSLPEWRQPPRFATGALFEQPVPYLRTALAAVFVTDFGAACSVWKARDASERFLRCTCLLTTTCCVVLVSLFLMVRPNGLAVLREFGLLSWQAAGEFERLGAILLVSLLAGLAVYLFVWGQRCLHMLLHRGRAAAHDVVIRYMSVWPMLTLVVGGTSLLIADAVVRGNRPWYWVDLPLLGRANPEVFIYLLGCAPPFALALLGISHTWRQLRLIRYANG